MQEVWIKDKESYQEFKDYLLQDKPIIKESNRDNLFISTNEYPSIKIEKEFEDIFDLLDNQNNKEHDLIFGKDKTEKIVAIEVLDKKLEIFFNNKTSKKLDNYYWFVSPIKLNKNTIELKGNNYYKFMHIFETKKEYDEFLFKHKNIDKYSIWNKQEAAMVLKGLTLFKGLTVKDVSVLAFDIEAVGLVQDKTSKVLMISNVYRDISGKLLEKNFVVEDYKNDGKMIEDWSKWVRSVNPDIITGHNIYGYDLPYINHCAKLRKCKVELGRDGSELKFRNKPSSKRIDQSQDWTYHRASIYGRQLIDGMFVAVNYDFSRKYPAWGLKPIIQYEYQEILKKNKKDLTDEDKFFISRQKNRTFYDASKIRDDWKDQVKRKEIIKYGIDDAYDSLYLYDLMISSYFYYCQSIPRTLQEVISTATGGQINSFLVRSYLQKGYSLPKSSERKEFEGAISKGNPGVYFHVNKMDVASLYPSIMITESVYDKQKDPNAHFLKMVQYFTKERLQNKKKAKETGDRYYKDIEQAQKIVINSAYGLLGTRGVNFNNFNLAEFVTAKGREILTKGMDWVKSKNYTLVNVDTDSFSYTTNKKLTDEEFEMHIKEVNSLFKQGIIWEDDNRYAKFVVVKAKNYAMIEYGSKAKMTIKGSALKATMKEPALQDLIKEIIEAFMSKKPDHIFSIYNKYCKQVMKDSIDITKWASKKTITKPVLNPERTNEQKIYDIIQDLNCQEGDKIYVYFKPDDSLGLVQNYNNDHNKLKLLEKIYKTMHVFQKILDINMIPNYTLGRNKDLLEELS